MSSPTAGGPRIGLGAVYSVLIDPADVGRRVTLRRSLPDEPGRSGDVVGTLERWADGVLVVRRRDGELVSVPEGTVLAARVVAPELSAADLQRRCAADWTPDESVDLYGWVLRFHTGLHRRSRSALALAPPVGTGSQDSPWDDAIAGVRDFYAAREAEPLALVVEGSAVDRALAARGCQVRLQVDVMVAGTDEVAAHRSADDVGLSDEPPARMLEVNADSDDARTAMRRLLDTGPGVTYASARRSDEVVGAARMTTLDGWAGLTFLEVAPEFQRQGIARNLVASLAARAHEQGVQRMWLQVEQDNGPALELYGSMGFERHHGYCYRALR